MANQIIDKSLKYLGAFVKKPIAIWTLANPSVDTTSKTVTITSGRKFSDFDLVVIMWQFGNYIRSTEVLPMSYISGNLSLDMTYVDTVNKQHWCDVKQLSDTTFSVQSSESNGYVIIYGIGGSATY